MGEKTFSHLGSGTAVQRGRAVLQPSKGRGIRAGSCNRSVDLSRQGTAQVALPTGCPPFLSSLPFLLPGVPFLPHNCEAATVEGRTGKTGAHMCPCQSC